MTDWNVFVQRYHYENHISRLADIEHIGEKSVLTLGRQCYIDSFVRIRHVGGSGDITIGSRVYINAGTVIFSGNGVKIGDDTLIAPGCLIMPVNHEFRHRNELIREQRFMPSKGGIIIGRDVWLGAGCIVLDGARIGDGCVIAAGSVVRGELEPYCVYAGEPLSIISRRA